MGSCLYFLPKNVISVSTKMKTVNNIIHNLLRYDFVTIHSHNLTIVFSYFPPAGQCI